MRSYPVLWILSILCSAWLGAADPVPVSVEDQHAFRTTGQPAVSPDGKTIAFTIGYYDPEKKTNLGDVYLMDADGNNQRRLTTHPAVERGLTWSPDSKRLAFSASREEKTSQIYVIDPAGGEAVKLTSLEQGASDPVWSPDGRWIAFYSSSGQQYSDEFKKELGEVRYLTHLRYTHNRTWDEGKRRRIFIIPADGGSAPRQLTKGECSDEGDTGLAWSPDSREIAFVSNRDPEWWNSIDTNIYTVSITDGTLRQITTNRGPDHDPAYSPDGSRLAWRSIFTYNYESENYKLVAAGRDGANPRPLTEDLDRSVDSFLWASDSQNLYILYGTEGRQHVRSVPAAGGPGRDILTGRHTLSGLTRPAGGSALFFRLGDDLNQPEIHRWDGRLHRLTSVNDGIMARFLVQPAEEVWFTSPDGTRVEGWIIKPVNFEKGRQYPMILSIHGGPHGMSSIGYNYTFQLWAANGFVVFYTNPRASLGYGEKFSRDIWEDWGGRCFQDIMAGVDHVLQMGFVDPKRLGVTGGSFGGYMTNWIVGHTNRFAAAVTVAGISNLTSFYGTTDEQFFPEAEFKGGPWDNPEVYRKDSPVWYAKDFKTPTMIIHGEFDFRVRTEQAEQMFTALQKQKVPSVYVWFPDEGHGVSKPENRKLYNRMMLDWFGHYLQGKPSRFQEMAGRRPYAE